jgi:hypothetical protein
MAKIRKIAVFVFLPLIFSAFPLFSGAQSYYEDEEEMRTFYGGLLLGGNFSQVDGDFYAGFRKAGLNAGGIVYAKLGNKIAASMEILFSQKGARGHKARESNTGIYVIQKYNIDLNYAEVPLMINYFDKHRSHFGAGVSYSQLISSSERIQTNPVYPVADLNKVYPFKKYDLNFVIGGNLHLVKGWFLNYHYQYSIMPIRDKADLEISRASKQFNNMHVLRVMYLF